jgi:hypothetical protein
MGFWNSLRDIRYFFKLLGKFWDTWFTPYHSDQEDEEEKKDAAEEAAAASDNAPDRFPKPSPPPVETTLEPGESVATAAQPEPAKPSLTHIMAFRGPMSKSALAAAMGEDVDQVGREVDVLVETAIAEDAGDGRYLLMKNERHLALRADPRVTDWLSRLRQSTLGDDALDVVDHLCRQLPVKITAGKNLVFHLRQQKWMVWQGREETCRVRVFGSLSPDQWSHIRAVDSRARRFRRRKFQEWDSRDWATFRWRAGADTCVIESVLTDVGRDFQRQVRRHRGPRRKPSAEHAPEGVAESTSEASLDTTLETESEPTLQD